MRNDRPAHVDLFSGIGGFALAARWAGIETVAFCEIEPYAQRVLRKNFPGVPIIEDVRNFPADEFQRPWLITGGYPCQPFSQAGQRRGAEDDRHLWPAMFEIIRSCRPYWVLAENVAGHVSMGLDEVLSDLESEDYAVQPIMVPACAVDAPHRRDRVWIVAFNTDLKHERQIKKVSARCTDSSGVCNVADSQSIGGDVLQFKTRKRPSNGIERKGNQSGENSQMPGNVAHAESLGHRGRSGQECGAGERIVQQEKQGRDSMGREAQGCGESCGKDVPDTNCSGEKPSWNDWGMGRVRKPIEDSGNHDFERWLPEPDVGRVAHGIPSRVDRLRGLGNAIVPQVAYEIIKAMLISNGT